MRLAARLRGVSEYDALVVTALVWFLAKFLRYAFPPLFPTFQASFGVSNALLGAAFTAMMTVYAFTQFPSGALADRVGPGKVVVGGALVAATGAFALALPIPAATVGLPLVGGVAAGFLALVGSMLFVGLGTGAHKTVAVRLLSRTYPARTGRALGALDTVGGFGGVVAPAAVVLAADVADWHALFLAGGLAGVGLAAAVAVRVPRRVPTSESSEGADAGADARAYLALFRDPRFTAFVGVALCTSFSFNGVVAFLPLYLTDRTGVTSEVASLLYSALFVASLVQLVTGDLSDRVGRLPVIAATLGLATTALVALLWLGTAGPLALGAAVVAFGLGGHGYRPARAAYLSATIPEDVAGGGLGVVRTLMMVAGAVSPAVVGAVSDVAGFAPAFGILAAAMGAATLLTGVVAALGGSG